MQSVSGSNATLNLQDSLNLLTTQLRHQDPLSPTDDTALVTQMTQLNQTQQLAALNSNVQSMIAMQRLTEASTLIGKSVTSPQGSGTVTAVTVQNGVPSIVVNGQELPLDAITRIGG